MSLVLVLSFALVGADPLPEVDREELKLLQGEWLARQVERDGKKAEFKEGDTPLVLEIRDTKWIFTGKEKGRIIALDPKADPKRLDLESVEEGRVGKIEEAVYKLEGDSLTICLYQGSGRRRPTQFKSEDADTILVVFQRVKR
jgi:uncharacterized protein (TIGR03067 family)